MENRPKHKNEVSNFISNIDLFLYSALATAFLFYGLYSLLMDLWSSGVGYFVIGILLFSGMIIQIGHDLYHKRIGPMTKIVLGIWVLATIIVVIGDLVSVF
jgi:hypothetical protein